MEQKRKEAIRKKDADIFKASLKQKNAEGGAAVEEEEDSDWESVEEDYPGVKLSELLDGLTLEVNNGDDDDDEAVQMEADSNNRQVSFAAPAKPSRPEEEKKQ